MITPAEQEYSRRLKLHRERSVRLDRANIRLSVARLVVAVIAVVGGVLGTSILDLSQAWLVIPVSIFVVLVFLHRRVADRQERAHRKIRFYDAGLARLENRWAGMGISGEEFVETDHPYAVDLDIFGSGSLFELLCTARTRSGEETLARWLLHPASASEIRERQQAVTELQDRLDLRERLVLQGEDIVRALHPAALIRWAEASPRKLGLPAGIAVWVLPTLTSAAILGWWLAGWNAGPAVFFGLIQLAFARSLMSWTNGVNRAVQRPVRELKLFSAMLAIVEQEPVSAEALQKIRSKLQHDGAPPSQQIETLAKLVVLLDSAGNMLFAPIAALVLWPIHMAIRIEAWRSRCGPQLASWFSGLGEFEALTSLSGYSYENPKHVFPEIVESTAPVLDATKLAHPLLPRDTAVPNQVELGLQTQVHVISGSNMSGKSTWLRTVGCNTVLALAGAPVRAERFRLTPLAVGASICTVDSLSEGRSRFFAEISRLKQIVDACAGELPVLFLLDEIMHGTNSHDRRIGAEALVRHLIFLGAIGLVTTHDLALARLSESLAPKLANFHFVDTVSPEGYSFDYRLRPGTVQTSNALELMRQVGLPIDGENSDGSASK